MTERSVDRPHFTLIKGELPSNADIDENPFPFGGGPEPVPTLAELHERRRTTPRVLSVYTRVAYVFHDCDECHHQIEPGSYYEGRVEVRPDKERYRILVMKKHIEPRCPVDPFEEEQKMREGEDTEDQSSKCASVA